jgi:hypothetical protein
VVQLERPALAVNMPVSHAAHVMSLLVVAAALMYSPAGHG